MCVVGQKNEIGLRIQSKINSQFRYHRNFYMSEEDNEKKERANFVTYKCFFIILYTFTEVLFLKGIRTRHYEHFSDRSEEKSSEILMCFL